MPRRLRRILLITAVLAGCGDTSPQTVTVAKPKSLALQRVVPVQTQPELDEGLVAVYFSSVLGSVAGNRANPENIAAVCARHIDKSQHSLDLCGQEIENQEIVQAVLRAAQRGVRVRVVTEADYANEAGPRAFRAAGIPVFADGRSEVMHDKFVVLDQQGVWIGSFDFTENGAYKNDNNAVYLNDPRIAANFLAKFTWFWEHRQLGDRPVENHAIPYPVVELADGTTVETCFSTHAQIDRRITAAIRAARRTIHFMAFSFTDDRIAWEMLERAKRGVRVFGVFEARQCSKFSEFERMLGHYNVDVRLDGNQFDMHHKVIVIDEETVIVGSRDFESTAAQHNDGSIVIIHRNDVVGRFQEEFARVFGLSASPQFADSVH